MRFCIRLITYIPSSSLTTTQYTYHEPELPFTCSNSNFVCATNTLHGVHGCCDPASLSSCTIATTCISSAALSTLCTDATCSNDPYILRCFQADLPNCYKWIVSYSKTSMTQHGCASAAFISTALRSYAVADVKELTTTVAVTVQVTPTPSSTPTFLPQPGASKPNLAAIVGGTIGGCTAISILILALLIYRRRRHAAAASGQVGSTGTGYIVGTGFANSEITSTSYGYPNTMAYSPDPNDAKKWLPHTAGPVTRVSDAVPAYPHMGVGRYGVVEVDGVQRPVEVEAGWNRR